MSENAWKEVWRKYAADFNAMTDEEAERKAMREALIEIERGPVVRMDAGGLVFNERTPIQIARQALKGQTDGE